MVRVAWLVTLAACGRLGFDPSDGASSGDGQGGDASPPGLLVSIDFEGSAVDAVSGVALTCVQCPTYGAGHVGMAAVFDNASCLSLPDAARFHTARVTLSAWFKPPAIVAETLFSKPYDIVNGSDNSYEIWVQNTTLMFSSTSGGANDYLTAGVTYTPGQWHHYAGTFDGATKRIYFDGVEVASGAGPTPRIDGSPLLIGCDIDVNVRLGFSQSLIDQVRLYDRALSPAELAQLAQ